MKKIALIEAFYSKRDIYGNTYWAMRYTDFETGFCAEGTISGGEGNIHQIMCDPVKGWRSNEYVQTCTQMGIRDFNRMTKNWKYAGCTRKDLVAFIESEISRKSAEASAAAAAATTR